jgi:accessory gene regulator protein AgrB
MSFTPADILNLIALFISMAGSFLMFYFTPDINSILIMYKRVEVPKITKRDAFKNKMMRRGMLLLLIGFIIQAAAIFLSVAGK